MAIVSVGAPASHLVLGADGGVEEREQVVIGCSFDHRAVDASYVTRFLDRVAGLLSGLDVASER